MTTRTSPWRRATVQDAVADRLGEMLRGDEIAVVEVGDGARHAQDAMQRARGEVERRHRAFEQRTVVRCEAAGGVGRGLVEQGIWHTGARKLSRACSDDAAAYVFARFAFRRLFA